MKIYKSAPLKTVYLIILALPMLLLYDNCTSGGGGSSSGPAVVKGVAASGSPISGATVTIKDSAGNSKTVTTGTDGSFQISPTGLTPPFILSVSSGGNTIYSYAGSNNTVANLNPYTAVILQAYFSVQGTTAAAVFGGTLNSTSLPSASQLTLLTTPVVSSLQNYLSNASVSSPTTFNPFTTTFTANGSGFDQVLDRTSVNGGLTSFTVDNGSGSTPGSTSSTVTLTVNAGSGGALSTVAFSTSTTNGGVTSTSQVNVPVGNSSQQSDLAVAQAGVLALFTAVGQVAAAKGSNLAASDVLPYIDAAYLSSGQNQGSFASQLASGLVSGQFSFSSPPQFYRINKFIDGSTKYLDATLTLTSPTGVVSYLDTNDNVNVGMVFKQESNGGWEFYGQQTVADAHISLQQERDYGKSITTNNYLSMQGQINTATGYLSAASVTGPTNSLPDCTQNPSPLDLAADTLVKDPGSYNGGDRWDLACSSLDGGNVTGTPPAAGTVYTFSITPTGSSAVQQTYALNSATNDNGDISTINGSSRATFQNANTAAQLAGVTLTVTYTYPTTYPILYTFISAFCQNASEVSGGGGTDIHGTADTISYGTTTGTITIPTLCDGAAPAAIDLNMWFIGVNGETSMVDQTF